MAEFKLCDKVELKGKRRIAMKREKKKNTRVMVFLIFEMFMTIIVFFFSITVIKTPFKFPIQQESQKLITFIISQSQKHFGILLLFFPCTNISSVFIIQRMTNTVV